MNRTELFKNARRIAGPTLVGFTAMAGVTGCGLFDKDSTNVEVITKVEPTATTAPTPTETPRAVTPRIYNFNFVGIAKPEPTATEVVKAVADGLPTPVIIPVVVKVEIETKATEKPTVAPTAPKSEIASCPTATQLGPWGSNGQPQKFELTTLRPNTTVMVDVFIPGVTDPGVEYTMELDGVRRLEFYAGGTAWEYVGCNRETVLRETREHKERREKLGTRVVPTTVEDFRRLHPANVKALPGDRTY